ncbi:pectinesterase family protein [Actinoplanes friuliensis]|uniref:Pectinesterase n=1 Tax=Actinoplanes friuliensis DSM 7358 TaxID=1246995 RepID=U5W1K1_9ACTN|nr:pectinesterase family protein [Actinoplanes friuliensis]AGZ41791.1 putative pectinesterase [Actinoplanes friuliensis DSM 7358]
MHRRTLIRLAATSGAAVAAGLATGRSAQARPGGPTTADGFPGQAHPGGRVAADGLPGPAHPGRRITVAADGSGDVTTVQAAIDAVPSGNTTCFTIDVRPGVYTGQVIVPADKPHVLLRGRATRAEQVVISDDRANGTPRPEGGTWGTSGSASVTVDASDFTATNLTFANTFDEAAHPEITGRQAVAVLTRADRLVFDHVRFLGNQDTLYLNSPAADVPARIYLRGCYVEGDVDFIFGRGTAAFDRCRIHSLTRGSETNNGYVTAPSTSITNPYGLLFSRCSFASDAPAASVFLGRPWHPSQDPNAIGQAVIRNSVLGAHIGPAPWSDFGTWSWRDARFAEFRNRGPGALVTPDRPQLTAAEATGYTVASYLAGTDGWSPHC